MTPTDTPKEENPASGPAHGTSVEIEILISGVTFGPFTEAKTRERLAEGLVALNDKARLADTGDWKTLQEVLNQILPSEPVGENRAPSAESTAAPDPAAETPPVSETKSESAPPLSHPATGRTTIIPPRKPVSGSGLLDNRAKIPLRADTDPLPAPARRTETLAKLTDSTSSMPSVRTAAHTGPMPLIPLETSSTKPPGGIRSQILARTSQEPLKAPSRRMSIRSTTGPLSFASTPHPLTTPPAPPPSGLTLPARFPISRPKLEEEPVSPPPGAEEVSPAKPETKSGLISPAHRMISVAALASGVLPPPRPPAAVTPGLAQEEDRPGAGDDSALAVKPPARRRTQMIKAVPGAALQTDALKSAESITHSFRPVPSAREKSVTAPMPPPGRPELAGPGAVPGAPQSERMVRRGMANASAMAATTPLAAFTKIGPPAADQEEEPPTEQPPELEDFAPLENFEENPESEAEHPSIPLVETRRAALREARMKRKRQNLIFAAVGLVFFLLICAGIYHYIGAGHAEQKPAPVTPPPAAPEKSSSEFSPVEKTKTTAAAPPATTPAAGERPPEDPKVLVHVITGQAAQAKGDFDGAIAEFTQAILLDSKYAPAFGYRAAARQAKGDLEGAIADDDQMLTLEPHNANGFSQRGFIKQANKDLDGALADYTRALELDPKLVIAFFNRGMIQEQKGQPDAAIADYNQALVLNPKLPRAYYNRGNAKMAKGDLDGAIADYTNALEINPKIALAACNRALAEQNSGNPAAAVSDYNLALALDPTIAMAYYNRGLIKEQQGDLDGCIADSTKAIELDPNNAQAYYNRGVALQAKGDLDAAANDLHKFGAMAPRNVYADYAHLYLWVINSQQSRKLEADQELSNCLDSSWNAEPAQLPSKIANFLLDHISESDLMTVASSPDAKKDRGQHCEAWYFDGIKKMLTGNKSAAIDCFHQCLNTGQKDFCEYLLAEAQLQTLSPS